ncbi:MAG: hypothetical protein E6G92_07825 [Alphaproteobacteria bacterium]|nr:MAG: hypothetical protein E6G92_07825 [Alphaproteobacteria bacterium]
MKETAAAPDALDRAATLSVLSRELAAWVPILRRMAETVALEINPATVRALIAARRLRDEHFWPAMSEGAWDVLLELFACRLEGRRLTVAELSDTTALPLDSVLHWIDSIAARGLISRRIPEGEEALVDLTDDGADRMRAYLLAALNLSPWAP